MLFKLRFDIVFLTNSFTPHSIVQCMQGGVEFINGGENGTARRKFCKPETTPIN